VVKRSFDIAFSAALLLFALPVLMLAALLIRLTSPGPVLFRQTRMGRGFQPFEILKLRTMAHAEGGLAFTFGPDPRITPVGKFLRRSKLDELPQLWNVLRGQMSLVGPRPVVPELTHEFREEYVFLLRARPGLTDPASLKYSQEARLLARSSDAMQFFKTVVTPDKIRISFEYMRQANLWTDLKTIVMTAVICAFPSMSRLYGELPEVKDIRVTEIWQTRRPERKGVRRWMAASLLPIWPRLRPTRNRALLARFCRGFPVPTSRFCAAIRTHSLRATGKSTVVSQPERLAWKAEIDDAFCYPLFAGIAPRRDPSPRGSWSAC
jgi:lipopolysaccharide/colanic/teichoic acid biosynthesis glycosyltransferase